MRTLKNLIAAGAATLMSTAAFAADFPEPPPMYVPPPVEDFGGWYLRGDIGFSNQNVKKLDNLNNHDAGISTVQTLGFDTAGIFGLGAGYQFNSWFRADVTGEYRGNANFHGYERVSFNNIPTGADTYGGSKSEWLFLANAYADLGTWWCITPFVGVGVGTARNTISNFTDQNLQINPNPPGPGVAGSAFADSASKWNFAWALHAGLAYKVSPGFTVELAYRYVDLGDGMTGDIRAYDNPNGGRYNPTTFKHITSQDLKLGVRWAIDPTPAYIPPMLPPLIRKG